jgi:hypothetical protein
MSGTVGRERKNIGASVGLWVPEGFSHGQCFHTRQKITPLVSGGV